MDSPISELDAFLRREKNFIEEELDTVYQLFFKYPLNKNKKIQRNRMKEKIRSDKKGL